MNTYYTYEIDNQLYNHHFITKQFAVQSLLKKKDEILEHIKELDIDINVRNSNIIEFKYRPYDGYKQIIKKESI